MEALQTTGETEISTETDNQSRHSLKDERLARLVKATSELLDPQSEPGVMNRAVGGLYNLFSEITGIKSDSESAEDAVDTLLSQGLALSPRGAARCIFHFERTARFLRGLKAAIIRAQQRFPGETIHVLYAGCGPYATLAVPLTTQFTPSQVQFTLLDIHRRSLDAAQGLAETLEVSDYIRDSIECDAAEYRHTGDLPFHIVVSEVMQKALVKEPQVAVTLNLAPQLREGGIFIPEKIRLDVCVAELVNGIPQLHLPDAVKTDIGRVFEITATTPNPFAETSQGDGGSHAASFPAVKLRIPEPVRGNKMLCILTHITVFESITLEGNDSWLTYPTPILDLGRIDEGAEIEFFYSTGQYPKLQYRVLSA